MHIRVTMQVADGPEVVVFGDEVTAERLCPTLSIAEHALQGALGALRTGAVIRQYIGTHIVKSVDAGRHAGGRNPSKLELLLPNQPVHSNLVAATAVLPIHDQGSVVK